jgi:hypothetical protein
MIIHYLLINYNDNSLKLSDLHVVINLIMIDIFLNL